MSPSPPIRLRGAAALATLRSAVLLAAAALLAAVALPVPAAAQTSPVPPPLQATTFDKIFDFDRALGDRGIQAVHLNRNPWPCGVVSGGETPNLMLGTAGIGYFYLRLYDSAAVPSVLMVHG